MKVWVQLTYDAMGKPYPIGETDNPRILVLVKHQLLTEAQEKSKLAEGADEVLGVAWKFDLCRLQDLLNLLIPPEIEELMLSDGKNDEG
jgi:hypothetical protein